MLALVVAAGPSGCSSSAALIGKKLDPVTSATITFSEHPLIFYRDVSGRAAFAKDYVYVAPVEVNRSGDYRYYIWLGIWTVDGETSPDAVRNGFDSIVLVADGEPLRLEITGWTTAAIGASEPVYAKPFESAADAYYELTLSQLRRLAVAQNVRLQSGGDNGGIFEPYNKQRRGKAALREFVNGPTY
jgi:hypothetical protein